jgi:hypothetical protein
LSCISSTKVIYKWEVSCKKPGDSHYVKLDTNELEKIITTPADGRSFSMKPNVITLGGVDYRFACIGKRGNKGTEGYAFSEKEANAIPLNGICDVTPKSGIALNTTFTITCSGWEDTDQPLSYTYGTAKG